MFCACGAPSNVINDVSIDAGPIDCLSYLCLHFLHPLVCSVEVSKGTVEEFWGTQTWCPFRRILALLDSSSQVPQKCLIILGTCLRWLGHPLSVKWYSVVYTRSHSMVPWMASSLSVDSCACWMFWWMGICRDFEGGEATKTVA